MNKNVSFSVLNKKERFETTQGLGKDCDSLKQNSSESF